MEVQEETVLNGADMFAVLGFIKACRRALNSCPYLFFGFCPHPKTRCISKG